MFKFLDGVDPRYCAIENVAGEETGGGGAPPPGGGEPPAEKQEKQSIREHLEKGFEDDRRGSERQERQQRPKRIAGGAEIDGEAGKGQQQEDKGQQQQQTVAVPEAFSKEAKAEWANVPPTVQAAIIKREQDMAKGVEELKGKYADLDKTIQPHMDEIRRYGHTPAQAVGQLFAWFQALAANPKEAFPALAKSFNFDLGSTAQPAQQQQVQQEQPPAAVQNQQTEIPEPVKNYISKLEKNIADLTTAVTTKIGSLETTWQKDSETKTQEILNNWAKDKPYFQEVRKHMGHLIGSGAVPLTAEGKIDLDKAYDMAVYAIPEVREKLLAEQAEKSRKEAAAKAEAEKKAQAEAAAKARAAGVGVTTGAPAAPGSQVPGRQRGKSKSVRESLQEAFEANRS